MQILRFFLKRTVIRLPYDCHTIDIRLTVTKSRLLLDMNTFVQDLSRM